MSRTRRDNIATLKPTTPLHTPNKGPMKPASPLRPKNTPKPPFLTRKGDGGFRQRGHLADRARPRHPWALKPCPAPRFHTWSLSLARGPNDLHLGPTTRTLTRWHARGPLIPHVNPMRYAWAAPPTRRLRGLRAYLGVNAHVQRFACEQHTAIDTKSAKVQTHCLKMTDFRRLLPNGSALWRTHHLTSWPHHHQTGEMASLEPRHAGDTPTASL